MRIREGTLLYLSLLQHILYIERITHSLQKMERYLVNFLLHVRAPYVIIKQTNAIYENKLESSLKDMPISGIF